MLAMASGGIATFGSLFREGDSVGSYLIEGLGTQLDHVAWRGCVFWDLIQPAFMFIVGAAMPLSYSARRARGDRWPRMFGHAAWRSLVLVVLGVFLASHGGTYTRFEFTNVLAQIGLGYLFVFVLLGRRPAIQFAAAVLILCAYWYWFATAPRPSRALDAWNAGTNEPQINMRGSYAHWNKNANAAASFDRWFLNLFPRPADKPFQFNAGGYTTLNFVPSIATMLFGVLAGELLGSGLSRRAKLQLLVLAGALGLGLGHLLDARVCPIVKRIWTPSWVVYSTGCTCIMLAAFYGFVDMAGFRRFSLPLAVVGTNSIAMYLMAQLGKPFVLQSLRTHFGLAIFEGADGALYQGLATLLVFWLVCLWLYRSRIFIKI
jgi:heparan-alpha-glucosaminide N-acetyltransferase